MAKRRKPWQYTWVAIMVIATLVVFAIVISDPNSMPYAKPTSFNSSSVSNSMKLILTIPDQAVAYDSNVSIKVSIFDTASHAFNISIHGYYTQANAIQLGPTSPCGEVDVDTPIPLGIAIFKGHYNLSDISNGTGELQLSEPGVYFGCPPIPIPTSYYFWPDSDNATVYILSNGTNSTKGTTFPIQANFTISGYWSAINSSGSNTLNPADYKFNAFPPGNYTVVAGNTYWKAYTVGYFRVEQ